MKVCVIFGCPGSGKSYLSKLIQSDKIIEVDNL